jgi:hypothetical protein
MPKIVIERIGYYALLRGVIIEIDGKRCAKVGINSRVECNITPGVHSVRARMDWQRSAPVQIAIKDGDVISFVCQAGRRDISLRQVRHTLEQEQISPANREVPGRKQEPPRDASSAKATPTDDNEGKEKRRPSGEKSAPWSLVLGVSDDASLEEIRSAYKKRISEYHPDKVAALGAEIREVAERRSKEINIAYSTAIRQLGATGTDH